MHHRLRRGRRPRRVCCATNGLKVLVIEAGPYHLINLDDPTQQPVPEFSNDELKFELRNFIEVERASIRARGARARADGDRILVGNVHGLPKHVGGGGLHADLKMPRFQPKTSSSARCSDVPERELRRLAGQYDELEPFYALGRAPVGVQGMSGANPFEGPRSTDYPMPPGAPMYGSTIMGQGLASLGYTMFPYPTAVNSHPYDGRPACSDCGFCSRLSVPDEREGLDGGDRAAQGAALGQLPAPRGDARHQAHHERRRGTEVTAFDDRSRRQRRFVHGRSLRARGEPDRGRAPALDLDRRPVGNSSGMVGRNLMFHFQTSRSASSTIACTAIAVAPSITASRISAACRTMPDHPLGGIVEISGSGLPISEGSFYRGARRALSEQVERRAFQEADAAEPGSRPRDVLVIQAEDAPQTTNVVDLDPALVDLDGLPVARSRTRTTRSRSPPVRSTSRS